MVTFFSIQAKGDVLKALAQTTSTVKQLLQSCSALTAHTGLFSCPSIFSLRFIKWQEISLHVYLGYLENNLRCQRN